MIVPMKKVGIICLAAESERTVERLRRIGVVHVEHSRPPKSKEIADLQDDLAASEKAIAILSVVKPTKGTGMKTALPEKDWKAQALHVIDLSRRLGQLEEFASKLSITMDRWTDWGDFDPVLAEKLGSKGIYIGLYQIPAPAMEKIPSGLVLKKISASRGLMNCAVISRKPIELPFKALDLPKISLSHMRERIAKDTAAMEDIKKRLEECARDIGIITSARNGLKRDLEFRKAIDGMGEAGRLSYLSGYVPFDAAEKLTTEARQAKWGVSITDPSDEDNVPTLIRNPKWISIIEPVFKFLEIVPGYKELDISPLLLLFLSLFFGMIIGDAGYGLLYIALITLARVKMGRGRKDAKVFFLLYLFSASAVLWGVLTGTVFGQEWYLKAGLKPLLPVLNDTRFLQMFCFWLGAFHLTLGQLWQGLRKLPSLSMLADVGWTIVLWAAFFLARMLILGYPLPGITKWLIISGVTLVIFFTNPQRNVLKMVGSGLGTVALSIMNNFTDVVSYVRLFAVGLAGIAISDTVNGLAASFGAGSVLTQVFILFVGHTINLVLGPISVLVHGVRLNVLEFSGHAGLSWSGTAYKPLEE